MNLDFYMPVKTISGCDCVSSNSDVLCGLGKKCMIVTGTSSAKKSGALDDVIAALEKHSVEYKIFDEVKENPYLQTCFAAGREAREFDADFIIGIGGGSPLDSAKSIAVFAANPDLKPHDIYDREWENQALPIILVGTTAGTGSEVSAVSVMTDAETGRKKALTDPQCFAQISFLDPKYTYSVPYDVTVSTALDALAHATEGFLSPKCTEIAELFARKAIPMIWNKLELLEESTGEISKETRNELYYGSIFAGYVLCSVGTAFPHPFGYILTEDFNIPHGRACAAFLSELFMHTMEADPQRAVEFLEIIDRPYTNFCALTDKLADFKNVKMTEEQIEKYSARWINLKNFKNVRGGYSVEKGKELFKKLFS